MRTRGDAARERLWAGMARESAHQLGTPLSSLAGWIELLEERASDDESQSAVVAHARAISSDSTASRIASSASGASRSSSAIDVAAIVERDRRRTFRRACRRSPTRSSIDVESRRDLPVVHGDPVLLEWAIEVLTKNAIDALAGRGGTHHVSSARAGPDDAVVIRVADDGPGVPRELRARVFEPGFSTKKSGWGIGLSLAKRIVEENHGGTLAARDHGRRARRSRLFFT